MSLFEYPIAPTKPISKDPEAAKMIEDGAKVLLSVSGGKDSTASVLALQREGIDFDAIHFRTGWDNPKTLDYIRGPLTDIVGKEIIEREAKKPMLSKEREGAVLRIEKMLGETSPMVRSFFANGMFPSRIAKYCTRTVKLHPMRDYVEELGVPVVSVLGVRADESERRASKPVGEWQKFRRKTPKIRVWHPILAWSTHDVYEILRAHNAEANPLYCNGQSRVGCWPCIYANKASLRNIARMDPKRIKILAELEKEMTKIVGEEATFFQDGSIENMVAWSKRGRIDEVEAPRFCSCSV